MTIKKTIAMVGIAAVVVVAVFVLWIAMRRTPPTSSPPSGQQPGVSFVLQEADTMADSASHSWWLDSGGYAYISATGTVSTVAGALPADDYWRTRYAAANSLDTDDGYHPQNLFRLISLQQWADFTEQAYFYIAGNEFSASPNRSESNGLLLFDRYQPDGQTLYYAGVRVDGAAVIKKKINGTYYTMAYKQIFPGTYDRSKNISLLPPNTWIGLRTDVSTDSNGVTIILSADIGRTGVWTELLRATDDGQRFGGAVVPAGYTGVRTDFMDVRFSDFKVNS